MKLRARTAANSSAGALEWRRSIATELFQTLKNVAHIYSHCRRERALQVDDLTGMYHNMCYAMPAQGG